MRFLTKLSLLSLGLALWGVGQETLYRNGVEVHSGYLLVVTDELDKEQWSLKDWLQDVEVACDKWLEFLIIRTNADPRVGPSLLAYRSARYPRVRVELLDAKGRRVERTPAGKTMEVSPPAVARTLNIRLAGSSFGTVMTGVITNWFKVQGEGPFLLEARLYYYRWTNGQYRLFLSDPVRLRVVCPPKPRPTQEGQKGE